jgi:hypothetical protein
MFKKHCARETVIYGAKHTGRFLLVKTGMCAVGRNKYVFG